MELSFKSHDKMTFSFFISAIQNLLREDSYSIISPRSYRPYHPVPTLPIKEPTDTSLLSLQRHPRLGLHENYSQLQPQRFMIPLQHANLQMQQQVIPRSKH